MYSAQIDVSSDEQYEAVIIIGQILGTWQLKLSAQYLLGHNSTWNAWE